MSKAQAILESNLEYHSCDNILTGRIVQAVLAAMKEIVNKTWDKASEWQSHETNHKEQFINDLFDIAPKG